MATEDTKIHVTFSRLRLSCIHLLSVKPLKTGIEEVMAILCTINDPPGLQGLNNEMVP